MVTLFKSLNLYLYKVYYIVECSNEEVLYIHTSVEKGLNNYTVLRSVDSDADNACSGVFLMSKLPLRGGTWSAWENDDGSRVMLWKPINPISYVEVKRLILLN